MEDKRPAGGKETDFDTETHHRLWHILGLSASAALIILAVFILARTLKAIDIHELRAAFENTRLEQFLMAGCFTALSYAALTGYDALALRHLRAKIPFATTALGSFTSYAISFTLGFPLVTGGAVRFWTYARAGLSATKVASLTIIAGITFWLGMGTVLGFGMIIEAQAIAELNQFKSNVNILIGLGILAAIAFYLFYVGRVRRKVRWRRFRLELPGLSVTLGQMMLGVIDVCAGAAALYVLLPSGHGLEFVTYAAVYVFAVMLGIASNAPGGIGIFEATMLKAIPNSSTSAVLASLLMFRIVYYVVPFILALALLGANEIVRRWQALREAMDEADE
eukprot:gene2450-2488_t